MNPLFTMLREELGKLWSQVRTEGEENGYLPLLRPMPEYAPPGFLSPLVTLATLLGLSVLSGVALGALGALFVALLGIWLLLTEVLGITIEVRPFVR